MSDMHFAGRGQSLLSHPPLYPGRCQSPGGAGRGSCGEGGSASPRYGTSPSRWRTRKPDFTPGDG